MHRPIVRLQALAAALAMGAAAPEPVLWSTPDAKLRYQLLPLQDGRHTGAVVQGEMAAGRTRLRTQVRIDAARKEGLATGVDLSWDLPGAGPVRGLSVGDAHTSGAAWSAPARMTGLRFGRAPVAAKAAPGPVEPAALAAGATDHVVEVGRLREGWLTPDRSYGTGYAASSWRAGLGHGLTAQARAEWSERQAAQGVELLQQLGGGAALQAMAAWSSAADADGARWGAAVVVPGQWLRWRLAYAAADRGFRSATGGAEEREGLRLETGVQLRQVKAQASIARRLAWDALEAESVLSLGGQVALTKRLRLEMDLSRRFGPAPDLRGGVRLALPFE
jgi:hypothetical protein